MTNQITFADRLEVTLNADYRQGSEISWNGKGGQTTKNGYDASINNQSVNNDPWKVNFYK